jgi:23S rRNA (guanine745-N1)-methyltransferase
VRSDVVDLLACPHCARGLTQSEAALQCSNNHSFDIARQGYVSLLGGAGAAAVGDSVEMVAARARFLDAGHYAPLLDELAAQAGHVGGRVVDVGAGTGHYLAAILGHSPHTVGIALDASKAAARRAAHVHPRAGSVLADSWQHLPIRDSCIDVVTSVFAPRRAAELRRVLCSAGALFVLTPTVRHLQELVGPLALLQVDGQKAQRLAQSMDGFFTECTCTALEFSMSMDHRTIEDLVGMGPSAWHATAQVRANRIAALPNPLTVTASVVLTAYRPAEQR